MRRSVKRESWTPPFVKFTAPRWRQREIVFLSFGTQNAAGTPCINYCFVRSYVVRSCPLFFCTALQCTSVVPYYFSAPRAQEGTRTTGTTWATHPWAPRGCEQRDTVLRTKLTTPEPRIARAPELVTLWKDVEQLELRFFGFGHPLRAYA